MIPGFSYRLRNEDVDKRTKSGLLYHWKYRAPRKNNAASAELSIPVDVDYELSFQRENWGTRLAKWLGFATEFQTGNTSFDKTIYIASDDPAIGNLLAMDGQLCASIQRLFDFGIDQLRLQKGRLTATMRHTYTILSMPGISADANAFITDVVNPMMWRNEVPPMMEEDTLDALVTALQGLKGKLPRNNSNGMIQEMNYSRIYRRRSFILNCIMGVMFAGGLALFMYDRVTMPHLVFPEAFAWQVVEYAAFGALGLLAIIYGLLHRSALGLGALKVFVILGVVGTGFVTSEAMYRANMQLDTSIPVVHAQHVLEKRITTSRSKHGSTRYHYHIIVEGWHAWERMYDMKVSRERYEQFQTGSVMRITTRSGYLNYEWIESYY